MMMRTSSPAQQRGVALVMALSVLVILTILGLSAMKGSTLEFRMANSMQDTSTAFQAAESALAESRASISLDPNQSITYDYTGKSGVTAKVITDYGGMTSANASRSESPDSGDDGIWFHFKQESVAQLSSGATTTIKAGFKQRSTSN